MKYVTLAKSCESLSSSLSRSSRCGMVVIGVESRYEWEWEWECGCIVCVEDECRRIEVGCPKRFNFRVVAN